MIIINYIFIMISLTLIIFFFFLIIRQPPISTLFPYTTLFRSAFALQLYRTIGPRNRVSAWLWSAGFMTSAVAALVGGTYHGFALEFDDYTHRANPWYVPPTDRKSTRLNSSHSQISYAVFCLTK